LPAMSALASISRNSPRFGFKQIAIGFLLLSLGAVAALAVVREGHRAKAPVVNTEAAAGGAFAGHQERPALSAEEEAYAAALWPVHEKIKTNAVQMTFAGLSYKLGDIDRTAIRERVTPLTKAFRDARSQAGQLKVPASLEKQHQLYLGALKLYEDASLEMVKIARDGKDEHLVNAQRMSYAASEDSLRVGDALWPGEYKPN
jgi:hypothetical protein